MHSTIKKKIHLINAATEEENYKFVTALYFQCTICITMIFSYKKSSKQSVMQRFRRSREIEFVEWFFRIVSTTTERIDQWKSVWLECVYKYAVWIERNIDETLSRFVCNSGCDWTMESDTKWNTFYIKKEHIEMKFRKKNKIEHKAIC